MSGMTKSKILEFLQAYPAYLLALVLAGFTTFLAFFCLFSSLQLAFGSSLSFESRSRRKQLHRL